MGVAIVIAGASEFTLECQDSTPAGSRFSKIVGPRTYLKQGIVTFHSVWFPGICIMLFSKLQIQRFLVHTRHQKKQLFGTRKWRNFGGARPSRAPVLDLFQNGDRV